MPNATGAQSRINRAEMARHGKASVSEHECRAMRQLDRDEDYGRSEIAFMFEMKDETVRRHCDRECHHNRLGPAPETVREYHDEELLNAFRLVYDRQPMSRMSQQTYEEYRPDDFPSFGTIADRFGGWPEARKLAWGESEEAADD